MAHKKSVVQNSSSSSQSRTKSSREKKSIRNDVRGAARALVNLKRTETEGMTKAKVLKGAKSRQELTKSAEMQRLKRREAAARALSEQVSWGEPALVLSKILGDLDFT